MLTQHKRPCIPGQLRTKQHCEHGHQKSDKKASPSLKKSSFYWLWLNMAPWLCVKSPPIHFSISQCNDSHLIHEEITLFHYYNDPYVFEISIYCSLYSKQLNMWTHPAWYLEYRMLLVQGVSSLHILDTSCQNCSSNIMIYFFTASPMSEW